MGRRLRFPTCDARIQHRARALASKSRLVIGKVAASTDMPTKRGNQEFNGLMSSRFSNPDLWRTRKLEIHMDVYGLWRWAPMWAER
jgi:hypothetical protein